MNLFSKKIAMFSLFAFGATFLMSFDQKSDDYGQAIQVYSSNQTHAKGGDVGITGLVRAAVGFTRIVVRTATHLTPEVEQMTYTIFGVANSDISNEELKKEKLYNLDK
ncbi:hypothetical protein WFZ85_09825 [Flavobacterium sp. j3]|uniref:DUF4359 domain-containing protein n=1 Tax=Flavobacterium aureirubrum TaxID=3133147 RepID=A0ABU9N8H8_9FLAO